MQRSNVNRLANKLNEFKNPLHVGISVGEVVKKTPLKVAIAGGSIKLTEGEELLVCESLKEHKVNAKWKWTGGSLTAAITGETNQGDTVTGSVSGATSGTEEGKITIDPKVKVGDKLLLVPMVDEQTWIAVDRIYEEEE